MSAFMHGHWAALHDSVYDTCGNPLHRLHRIPREGTRLLPDVISNACRLIDRILLLVDQCYTDFSDRVEIVGNGT